jgi:hypothetical protein
MGDFFDMVVGSQDGMPPYLLGYKGYSLVPLLMIQHKKKENISQFWNSCTITNIEGGGKLLKMTLV